MKRAFQRKYDTQEAVHDRRYEQKEGQTLQIHFQRYSHVHLRILPNDPNLGTCLHLIRFPDQFLFTSSKQNLKSCL